MDSQQGEVLDSFLISSAPHHPPELRSERLPDRILRSTLVPSPAFSSFTGHSIMGSMRSPSHWPSVRGESPSKARGSPPL